MIEHTPSHIESAQYYFQCLFTAWPVKSVVAGLAAFLSTEQVLIYWLMGMLIADLVFGLWEALRRHRFSCRILGRGILKIPCYCAYILLVDAVDVSISTAIHWETPLLELFIAYLVATDAVSVMGHMIRCGLPVPKRLRQIILHAQLRAEHELDRIAGEVNEKKESSEQKKE